jgi:CubicO group peptidase (beta-lactamase class C family)
LVATTLRRRRSNPSCDIAPNRFNPDGIGWGDLDSIAARLAESKPSYEPGNKHTYHALTIGWLLAEIVRWVDGRTIGQFFAEEIAGPLALEAWIGLPHDMLEHTAYVHDIRLDHLPKPLRNAQQQLLATARDPHKLIGRAFRELYRCAGVHGANVRCCDMRRLRALSGWMSENRQGSRNW